MRAKLLAAFLAGMVAMYGVRAMQDYPEVVNFRLDRIEQHLSQGGGAGAARSRIA
jgi:hypothetical protein